jgi:perosamine synthetase
LPESQPKRSRPRQGPIRPRILPYGRQTVTEDDIQWVVDVLRSDWLTTGPAVGRFEQAIARYVRAAHAVAVSSGTAALHAAMFALGIGPGDEVIVPATTFAATANCVVHQGGIPVFADVDPQTLLLDPAQVEIRITRRTRAIIAVDFAGQPCDYEALGTIARDHQLALVDDGSHALGAADRGRRVGSLADLTTFSFHPVKAITTGEGGMVTTHDHTLAELMRRFRNHGFSRDHHRRSRAGSWHYEMTDLGYNYRLTDFQCALGLSQLSKLDAWLRRRGQIARRYDQALSALAGVRRLGVREGVVHAWHLYVIRLDRGLLGVDRAKVFEALRAEGIGVGVHYMPVYLHPFYCERFGTGPGLCPVAESAYEEILSLPLFPAMTDADVPGVVAALKRAVGR